MMYFNAALGVLLKLLSTETSKHLMLVIFKHLAQKTEWTTLDDELVAALEERFKEE